MADFCLECAKELDFPTDLDGITSIEEWLDGLAAIVLCEGCGLIQVDPLGRRQVTLNSLQEINEYNESNAK